MEENGLRTQPGRSQRNGEVGAQRSNSRMLVDSLAPAVESEGDNHTISPVSFDGFSTNASSSENEHIKKIAVSVTQWLHNRKPMKYKFSRGKMTPIDPDKRECYPECGHGICTKGYFSLERKKHFVNGVWKIPVQNGHDGGIVLLSEDLWFVDATLNRVNFMPTLDRKSTRLNSSHT